MDINLLLKGSSCIAYDLNCRGMKGHSAEGRGSIDQVLSCIVAPLFFVGAWSRSLRMKILIYCKSRPWRTARSR